MSEFRAVLRCPPDTVDDAHDFLAKVWVKRPDVTSVERMAIETALSELVANVVKKNFERSFGCELTVAIDPGRLVLEMSDSGEEVAAGWPAPSMPADEAESGRGLILVRMLCDDLSYRRVGLRSVWRAEKRRVL